MTAMDQAISVVESRCVKKWQNYGEPIGIAYCRWQEYGLLCLLCGSKIMLSTQKKRISYQKVRIMRKNKGNTSVKKKNFSILFLLTAIVTLFLVVAVILILKSSKQDDALSNTNIASDSKEVQMIESGGSLIIPVSDISSTAQFYSIEIDGVRMEVLAVKDSDGNIRTAFNTCQICYSSGRGYYVQDGDRLFCQNCGNQFTMDQVEIESGSCNPWPIAAENKTVTDDAIEISYDFLKESKDIFANWKNRQA